MGYVRGGAYMISNDEIIMRPDPVLVPVVVLASKKKWILVKVMRLMLGSKEY